MSIITESALNKAELMFFKLYYQVDIRRVKEMNKISKRLFSIGLSVATCSMLVYPVLAEDTEQPVTTQVEEQATQKEYNIEICKLKRDGSHEIENTTFTLPSNATDDDIIRYINANLFPEGYEGLKGSSISIYKEDDMWHLTVQEKATEESTEPSPSTYTFNLNLKYEFEDREETKTVTIENYTQDTNISDYIVKNCVPEGYKFVTSYYDRENGRYVLTVAKGVLFTYEVYLDGESDGSFKCGNVDRADASKEEIKNEILRKYISKDYDLKKYDVESIEEKYDGAWVVNLVTAKKSTMKTYYLQLLICDQASGAVNTGNNSLENARVEYHTFEFDSSLNDLSLVDYITKNFIPEGYAFDGRPFANNQVLRMRVYKIDPNIKSDQFTRYTINYIDGNSGEVVDKTECEFFDNNKKVIKTTELDKIPVGYVFDGDSFKVTKENDNFICDVKIKKGELEIPVVVRFYEELNGELKKVATVKKTPQEMDLNNNGLLEENEFKNCVPQGYKLDNFRQDYNPYIFNGAKVLNQNYYYVVRKDSEVNQTEESKKIATIENKDLNKVLTNSLTTEQKEKVEAANKEGKSVDYKPILKEKIDNKEKKELLAYVDKEDNTKVVSTFDIEIQLFIDDKNEGTISETSSELTFKVAIPENLKKEGRKFYVLRYHDGKVDKLAVSEDGTFKTDKFSSYMLVYEDTKPEVKPETKPEVKPEVKPETKPEVKPSTKPETKPSTKPETKPSTSVAKKDNKTAKKVNTGVKNSTAFFTGLMGVSVAALGVVEVLKRRSK